MPKRLFIHLQSTEPVQAAWLLVDEAGKIVERASHSDLGQLPTFHNQDSVIVLVPGQDVLLTRAALPKLSRQQLQQALPYSLEEQLTRDVDQLHFATTPYQSDGSLAVAIVAHEKITAWLAALQQVNITPSQLIPTTLALPFAEDQWQINTADGICTLRTGKYAGFVCDEPNLDTLLHLLLAEDAHSHSAKLIRTEWSAEKILEQFAAHFATLPTINLLQNLYQPKKQASQTQKIWLAASAAVLLWIILAFTGNIVSYFILHSEVQATEKKINIIYQRHFPQAKSVIAPRERMTEKLRKMGQSGQNNALALLASVGNSFQQVKTLRIARMELREQQLTLEVTANAFSDIDKVTQLLTQQGLTAKQQNAASSGTQVKATLLVRAGGK